jgi:DNA-binding IclR family transcriptional regulator
MAIGISALGAPIYDHSGKVIASISLSGLTHRYEGDRIQELTDILRTTASQLSREIGGGTHG